MYGRLDFLLLCGMKSMGWKHWLSYIIFRMHFWSGGVLFPLWLLRIHPDQFAHILSFFNATTFVVVQDGSLFRSSFCRMVESTRRIMGRNRHLNSGRFLTSGMVYLDCTRQNTALVVPGGPRSIVTQRHSRSTPRRGKWGTPAHTHGWSHGRTKYPQCIVKPSNIYCPPTDAPSQWTRPYFLRTRFHVRFVRFYSTFVYIGSVTTDSILCVFHQPIMLRLGIFVLPTWVRCLSSYYADSENPVCLRVCPPFST